MIEYFKDRKTGKVFPNQTVLCEFYVFWRENMLREEDKAPNVVCVLTGDWSGVRLSNDKKRVRIQPIRFVLPEGNIKRTLEDYRAAEVELPENIADLIDESQIEKVRHDAFRLYDFKIHDPEFLKALPEPPERIDPKDQYNILF